VVLIDEQDMVLCSKAIKLEANQEVFREIKPTGGLMMDLDSELLRVCLSGLITQVLYLKPNFKLRPDHLDRDSVLQDKVNSQSLLPIQNLS
jgi:hypothetical protein